MPPDNRHRSAARSYRSVWTTVFVLCVFQSAYAAAFIWRSSIVVEGTRYFCLFDDAMISMRYADNWARGLGWVWNAGERVEGYTNFGWTLLLGLLHLPGLSPSATCLLVQVIGVPVLWGCLYATAVLARACRLLPAVAGAALLSVAALYNLHYFTLLGMETGLLTLLVTLALAAATRALRGDARAGLGAMLWLAPALLIRSDVLILVVFVAGFLLVAGRRARWPTLAGLGVVVVVLVAHTWWRHLYYGETAPNTYHLKLTGWPLERRLMAGLRHSFWTALQYGVPVLLGLAALIRARRWHLLVGGTLAVLVAYQVYCGGDAWPLNRFVLPAAPAVLVLAAQGALRASRLLIPDARTSLRLTVGGMLACLLAMHAASWPRWLLIEPPDMTGDNRMNVRYHVALTRMADGRSTVAVGYAGTLLYYSRRYCVDLYGKCEPHIARLPVTSSDRPGHNKMDLPYVITQYQPDVILHAAFATTRPPLSDYYPVAVSIDGVEQMMYVRRASARVRGGRPLQAEEALRMWQEMTTAPGGTRD